MVKVPESCGVAISGININPLATEATTLKIRRTTATRSMTALCLRFHDSSLMYPLLKASNFFPSGFISFLNIIDDIAGTRVNAITRLARSEYVMVRAISVNSSLVMP